MAETRCCKTCKNFVDRNSLPEQERKALDDCVSGVCYESGFTEIGNPKRQLTEEDCNAWIAREPELPEEIPLDELLEMEGTILDYETFNDIEKAKSFLEEKKKVKPTAAIYTELDGDVYLKDVHYVNRTGRYIVAWPLQYQGVVSE
jgi:hypothetical protein